MTKDIQKARDEVAAQKLRSKRLMVGLVVAFLCALASFIYSFNGLTQQGDRITKIEQSPCQEKPSGIQCAKLAKAVAHARTDLCNTHPASIKCRYSVEYACSVTHLAGLGCPRLANLPVAAGRRRTPPTAGGAGSPPHAAANAPAGSSSGPVATAPAPAPVSSPTPTSSHPSGSGSGPPPSPAPAPPPKPPHSAPPPNGPIDHVVNTVHHVVHGGAGQACGVTGNLGIHVPVCP